MAGKGDLQISSACYLKSINWRMLRSGGAREHAWSDRDAPEKTFMETQRSIVCAVVSGELRLWGETTDSHQSNYQLDLLGYLQEVSYRCKC